MDTSGLFTPEEVTLIADEQFFRTKAAITKKVRSLLDDLYHGLQEELTGKVLLAPTGFSQSRCQVVKGDHLEDFPYQYLDFPKHFVGENKFTFRSLFWWGHHFAFALMLEGEGLRRYKENLMNRFHTIAGRDLSFCLAPSLWEWKCGEGFTLPITHDRKSEIAAVLAGRTSFKIARFLPPNDQAVIQGRVVEVGRAALRAILPIITP